MAEASKLRDLYLEGNDDDEEADARGGCSVAAAPPCRDHFFSAVASVMDRQIYRHRRCPHPDCCRLDSHSFVPIFSASPPPSSCLFPGIVYAAPGSTSIPGCDDLPRRASDLFGSSTPRRGYGVEVDLHQNGFHVLQFGDSDAEEDMDSGCHLFGRGRSSGFRVEELLEDGEVDVTGMDLVEEDSDWGDAFLVGEVNVSLHSGGGFSEGLGGIPESRQESDSDDAELGIAFAGNPHASDGMGDLSLPLCWDCLRIEEDVGEVNEDFDWEEVGGVVDEGGVFCEATSVGQDGSMVQREADVNFEIGNGEEATRDIEWEVLSTANDLETTAEVGQESPEYGFNEEQEGFVYTSEYDILVGQFANDGNSIKGNPPAAKSLVERLPSVVFAQIGSAENDPLCAVCKDEISMVEKAKQLPCLHHYHADCILPWLRIRNTCPVCRYELPTDDPEYENWRIQQACDDEAVRSSHIRQF